MALTEPLRCLELINGCGEFLGLWEEGHQSKAAFLVRCREYIEREHGEGLFDSYFPGMSEDDVLHDWRKWTEPPPQAVYCRRFTETTADDPEGFAATVLLSEV